MCRWCVAGFLDMPHSHLGRHKEQLMLRVTHKDIQFDAHEVVLTSLGCW